MLFVSVLTTNVTITQVIVGKACVMAETQDWEMKGLSALMFISDFLCHIEQVTQTCCALVSHL